MKAEIIAVGTELLLGQISNIDAQIISEMISPLGIDMYYHTTVGDNEIRITQAIQQALTRSDIIFTTGGLGPTMDDLTKETVAKVLDLPMELREDELKYLDHLFTRRGLIMPKNNIKQAVFPRGGIVIPNPNGTAPGVIIEHNQGTFIILPGPPRELRPMMEQTVIPYLYEKWCKGTGAILSRTLRLTGIGESAAEEAIREIIEQQTNPTIAPLAGSEVTFRITAKAACHQEARQLIDEMEEKVRAIIGDQIYGTDQDTMESVIGRILLQKNWMLAVAESCTGGMISARITNVPGASSYFERGFICYSNQAKKEMLEVPDATLAQYGAVSEETALAMAKGAVFYGHAQIALSVTGIAGPTGGTENKPVGYVCFGISGPLGDETHSHMFSGDRTAIRARATQQGLRLIWQYLRK
jgi:nicotinamide-nucleotide amidase